MKMRGQELANYIKRDREGFRAEATEALRRFTPEDREIAASLQTKKTVADDILKAWDQQISPLYTDLEAQRESGDIKTYLARTLGFRHDEAEKMADVIIDERKHSLLEEVLDNLYADIDDDEPYQRAYAAKLLSRPEIEVDEYMSRYIDFVEATAAADKFKVTLCDPHTSWLDRQRMALTIYKERSKTSKQEDDRLEIIESELSSINNDHNSIIGKILDRGWEFTTIMSLSDKYQRQIDKLTATQKKDPTKRLKIFETVTASFRTQQTEKAAKKDQSIHKLREANNDVYDLLLEIFDLSMTAKTKLTKDIERQTRLSQERTLILLIQRNREHFLNSVS